MSQVDECEAEDEAAFVEIIEKMRQDKTSIEGIQVASASTSTHMSARMCTQVYAHVYTHVGSHLSYVHMAMCKSLNPITR